MSEAQNEMHIPADIAVGVLRNEIARLNDERMTLAIQVNYLTQVVEAQNAVITGAVTIVDPDAEAQSAPSVEEQVDEVLAAVVEDDTP